MAAGGAIGVFAGLAMGQQLLTQRRQHRPVQRHSLTSKLRTCNAGRGMGLALAAELNGYPGPIHAIELAEQLHLSPDQISKLQSLFEAMKAETIRLGTSIGFAGAQSER